MPFHSSTDETATESILKSEQAYASICGKLDMTTPRDAFITALCKASLPPHYTLTILNTQGVPQRGKLMECKQKRWETKPCQQMKRKRKETVSYTVLR